MNQVLDVQKLEKSYGQKVVLKDLSFSISEQQIVAFLGPNGAGKSTTLKIIMGLRRPDSGTLRIFDSDVHSLKIKDQMGYTSQDLSFPAQLKVEEILKFVSAHYSNPVPLPELTRRFELTDLMSNKVGGLSGGQKRRLGLACAMVGRPKILILDEPTTGLDVESRHQLWQEIKNFKKNGGTVLLSTHDLNEAGTVADRVLVIDHGNLISDGTVEQIKKKIDYQKITYEYEGQPVLEYVQDSDHFVKNLVSQKPHFKNLHIHPSTLEEAFLKIRGKS